MGSFVQADYQLVIVTGVIIIRPLEPGNLYETHKNWTAAIARVGGNVTDRFPLEKRSAQNPYQDFWDNLHDRPGSRNFRVGHRNYSISDRPGATNKTAYWVMRVPKRIMPDHGGVFEGPFWGFMGAIFRITQIDRAEPAPSRQLFIEQKADRTQGK